MKKGISKRKPAIKKKKENKMVDQLLKYVKENNEMFIIFGISILILIVASFNFGFLVPFIFILIMDTIIWIVMNKKDGKKRKSGKHSKLKIFLIIIFSLGILLLLSITLFFLYIAKTAPDFKPELMYQKEASILYMNDGEIMAKLGIEKREKITYEEMPQVLIDAVIATEDSRFFQHNGFDLPRFIKATLGQLAGKSTAGGASTLTMQLSKNIYTSTEDEGIEGIIRKFKDIYMSIFKIEKQYTKPEILEFYMNYNYLGGASRGGAYGVEQACLIYFGKSAKDINLSEAALIAGLFNSPNALDPLKNPEAAEKRRSTVLYLMELHGYITSEEREIANSIPVSDLITKDYESNDYQNFIDTVAAEVRKRTGKDPYTVPMEIYTTMIKSKQEHVNSVMSGEKFKWNNEAVQAGVAVLDTKTGAIVAIGANRNTEGEKNYNYATMIKKQIGSTAKPLYDYGPAIEYNNWSTYTLFADEPFSYTNGASVNNWDGNFLGLMTMRSALSLSRNIPALKTFKNLNNNNVKEFVTKLGLSPEIESGKIHEAHSIGGYNGESPLTVAAAYAAFGNKGTYNEPYSFTKVIFRETGEVYENKTSTAKVMNEDTAYMITSILLDTARIAILDQGKINNASVALKTGTTNFPIEMWDKYKNLSTSAINDLWVAGYDPEYTMAVWYGYDEINQDYVNKGYYTKIPTNVHGILFNALGRGIFTGTSRFTQPSNVVAVTIEAETNPAKLPSEFTPSNLKITELFKKGTEPTETSDRFSKLDKVTNLTSKVEKNILTLTWEPIKTPNAINESKIKESFKSLYTNPGFLDGKVNERLAYNKEKIGTIIYSVYYKDINGDLVFVDSTAENEIKIPVNGMNRNVTYIVKTTYTIFKNNTSDGAEITVDLSGMGNMITATLTGKETIELEIDNIFTEETQPVIVTENLIDVTKNAQITVKIVNSKNEEIENLDTSKPETYTITYNISYKDFKDKLVKKVIIKNKS